MSNSGANPAGAGGTSGKIPAGATLIQIRNQVAAGAATPISGILAAAAGKTTWLTYAWYNVGTAAAAGLVIATLTGLLGGNAQFEMDWNTTNGAFVSLCPAVPLSASAVNTALTVTIPSTGAGGPSSAVFAAGYQL